jgi:hypothetical protein
LKKKKIKKYTTSRHDGHDLIEIVPSTDIEVTFDTTHEQEVTHGPSTGIRLALALISHLHIAATCFNYRVGELVMRLASKLLHPLSRSFLKSLSLREAQKLTGFRSR